MNKKEKKDLINLLAPLEGRYDTTREQRTVLDCLYEVFPKIKEDTYYKELLQLYKLEQVSQVMLSSLKDHIDPARVKRNRVGWMCDILEVFIENDELMEDIFSEYLEVSESSLEDFYKDFGNGYGYTFSNYINSILQSEDWNVSVKNILTEVYDMPCDGVVYDFLLGNLNEWSFEENV